MAFIPTYFLFPRAQGFIACTAAISLTLVFSCKEAALEVTIKGGMKCLKKLFKASLTLKNRIQSDKV